MNLLLNMQVFDYDLCENFYFLNFMLNREILKIIISYLGNIKLIYNLFYFYLVFNDFILTSFKKLELSILWEQIFII